MEKVNKIYIMIPMKIGSEWANVFWYQLTWII